MIYNHLNKAELISHNSRASIYGCNHALQTKMINNTVGIQSVACRGGGGKRGDGPGHPRLWGIKRVKLQKLHFIILLKIYAFSYRKSTNTCCMDLIGSCLEGTV